MSLNPNNNGHGGGGPVGVNNGGVIIASNNNDLVYGMRNLSVQGGGGDMMHQNGVGAGGGGGAFLDAGEPIRITRRLNIAIKGSLSDFAQDGQGGATWRCVEGKQATIWGIQDLINSSNFSASNPTDGITHASATNILSTAVIKEVHLLEHKSTFKIPLGVVINCLPSHEMTANGEAFCYTVLPDSISSVPLKLFQAAEESEESASWRQKYPAYNASNLEKEGVIKLNNNTSYYLVHEAHPAIALILANKDLLGANFDENKKVDSEYYKVEMTTMASCCNVLRNKVLANMPISDLGKFSFEVRRLGTRDWLDLQDGEDALASFCAPLGASPDEVKRLEAKHLEDFCEARCSYHARLEVTFEVQP